MSTSFHMYPKNSGMYLKIKKLHPDAKLPTRGTEYSAGLDLYSTIDLRLDKFSEGNYDFRNLIPIGFSIEIPDGMVGIIKSRSGLANQCVDVCAGVIDSDYRGEIKVMLQNNDPCCSHLIKKGDRIAQLLIMPYAHYLEPMFVDELDCTTRGDGGFGSTGV